MSEYRVFTSLGEMSDRLRRAFKLAGEINPQLEQQVIPTVLVDDATRPGTSLFRGRSWMGAGGVIAGAAGTTVSRSMQAVEEIVVNQIFLTVSVQIQVRFMIATSSTAAPYAMSLAGAFMTERNLSSNELAPITTGGSATVQANGAAVFVHTFAAGSYIIPVRIHLPVGGRLGVDTAALTGDFSCAFAGQIF